MAVVGKEGLEPTRLSAPDPKSGSSTNSDTSPTHSKVYRRLDIESWHLVESIEIFYSCQVIIKLSNLLTEAAK